MSAPRSAVGPEDGPVAARPEGLPTPPGPIPILESEEAGRWLAARATAAPDPALAAEVEQVFREVAGDGDAALLDLTERYDGIRPGSLRVSPGRCSEALAALPRGLRGALERARRNVGTFHAAQRRREPPVEVEPGVRAWREFRPIERVGIYAPGRRAPYPSSVLMAAVPARLAGCAEVVVCSPPGPGGEPAPAVLAAAALAGVDEVYAVGGAQAVAALALGTETIRRVDKIFGPGSARVNAAKLRAFGVTAVDLPAGPSEVVVWDDGSAPAAWVAAELLAQAEHGPDSTSVAVVESTGRAAEVAVAVAARLAAWTAEVAAGRASAERAACARASLAGSAILVARDGSEASGWVDELAAEHLVLLRRDARERLAAVRHAGAVFLGPWSPVAAGDYASGTNHVLPTGRRARGAGGLSLDDFGRWIQVQELEAEGLRRLAPSVLALAGWEGFEAHAASVRERLREPEAPAEAPPEAPERAKGRCAAALVRSHLLRVSPYSTAHVEAGGGRGGILLDANENALGTLAPELDPELHRYPDPGLGALRAALAERFGVRPDSVWVGNGSDEAVDVLLRAVVEPGEPVVVTPPTYAVYAIRAATHGAAVREAPLDAEFDLDVERTLRAATGARLVFLCSPNNPTGGALSPERVLEVAARSRALVVVDEAYVEFAEAPSLAPLAAEHERLVVVRTLSKAWGLAGARVGWLAASPALVELLGRAGLPYPLSTLSLRAALLALSRREEMRRRRDLLVAERKRMWGRLAEMGIRVLPSSANFLLFFVPQPERVWEELAEGHGILVRDRSRLPRLAGALRVTVGTPEENDAFLAALETAL